MVEKLKKLVMGYYYYVIMTVLCLLSKTMIIMIDLKIE